MDQMCSGSGFFPPRLLHDDWFSQLELEMISKLERLLQGTGHAALLARDMMALRIYDVDIRIIADDSSSMGAGMIGRELYRNDHGGWTQARVQRVFGKRAFQPASLNAFRGNPFLPTSQRWELLKHHLLKWEEVFSILQVRRKVYMLNRYCDSSKPMHEILSAFGGATPMGSTFANVLNDYRKDGSGRPLLILALTDGEANDKRAFNNILDEIQDGVHGDVQVCLMGLSLEPEDIEWFEDEECDDTRIRTIEAWEVEQQMILYRKVIPREANYSFDMHVYRALVTNYFPADYDYEAPLQTLRHRLYITLHALDRRFTGERDVQRPSGMPTDPSGMPTDPITCALNVTAGAALFGCLLGGAKGCACAAGLGGCISAALASTRRRGIATSRNVSSGMVIEEELNEHDEQVIDRLVREWQRLSLQCRRNVGSWRMRSPISPIPYSQLRSLQYAVGTLSPSEQTVRDLQFQDMSFNNKALEVSLGYLRAAAQG
eukprot:TRINITY_DN57210_c0_g1_i1.p1 TRINITY_DN57210_c0_g1~~TRINITY_DN57210_c0_g1_i1.p1  ORF type:complete len:561 (-),score=43.41 TRINITY_DN57210_c0_g1_i1:210-1676(-)